MPSIVGYAVKVTSPAYFHTLGVVVSAIDGFIWQIQKCTVRIPDVGDVELKRGEFEFLPQMNLRLKKFWRKQGPKIRVLFGGRGSSKTWDAGALAIDFARRVKIRVCCVRQFQNKIAESVYALLKSTIERFGYKDEFTITKNSIIHDETGSEFLFYGLARNINEIKGLENIDLLWVEEAENLTEDQYNLLLATVSRVEASQIWVIFNPKLRGDFIYRHLVERKSAHVICHQINYTDNPFLPRGFVELAEEMRADDIEMYNHIYLGMPKDDGDDVIIKYSWIRAAIDAHLKLGMTGKGARKIGYDVAGSGVDKCAQIRFEGNICRWGEQWKAKEHELVKSMRRVYDQAVKHDAIVIYDADGLGNGTKSSIEEENKNRRAAGSKSANVKSHGNHSGGAVHRPTAYFDRGAKLTNEDAFKNIKAQTWWEVARLFMNTYNAVMHGAKFDEEDLISIDSSGFSGVELDILCYELSTPQRDESGDFRRMVERKEDLAKRGVKSPNLADAFICARVPGVTSLEISDDLLKSLGG